MTHTYEPSEAEVAAFHRDGYLITPPLFDAATLSGAREAIERRWVECNARIAANGGVGTRSKAAYSKVRPELPRLHLEDPELAAFCRHPSLAAVAARLIGPDVDMSWNQAYTKAPSGDPRTAIPWHQDAYYAAVDGPTYNCWVAITRATVETGTIVRAPLPADDSLLPHVWDEELLFYACHVDERDARPVELEPGQAFIFRGQVPHRSGINVSDEVRVSYSLSFTAPTARLRANGEAFGDRVPVLRGGARVDPMIESFVLARRPPAHPARAVLDEILARAPLRQDEVGLHLDACEAAILSGDRSRATASIGRLLSILPDSDEALGDLLRARARVDQLLRELAGVRGTDARVERLLAERILQLEPGHPVARAALRDLSDRP